MLKECLEVFEEILKKEENLILDSYIPADGTYIFVDAQGKMKEPIEIELNKKTREIVSSNSELSEVCFYDYHSQLVSMNKPVDTKKIIHSNNYYSFFVKKESVVTKKLTETIIDGYYEMLKNPLEQKYKKSKEASKLYEVFEESAGSVPLDELEKNKEWIKSHIFNLENVDFNKKNYLKIFFETEHDNIIREERRYLLPNIYNNNDYNVEIEGTIHGLPDNNMGMNAKKPYLETKTRKIAVPYLLDSADVMLQREFFNYLMNMACAGKCDVYIDTVKKRIWGYRQEETPQDVIAGYYLRIKKGKELEIQNQDNIAGFSQNLTPPFDFKNICDFQHLKHPEYLEKYKRYYTHEEVGKLIHEVFFSKYLENNYAVQANEINITDTIIKNSILISRDVIQAWVRRGADYGFFKILEKVSLDLMKSAVLNGYQERALWQLNLRWSFENYFLKGDENMGTNKQELVEAIKRKIYTETEMFLENDEEYYYIVGQMAAYLFSQSKAKNKNQSLINPFLNAKKDEVIKLKLAQLYKKYNYAIPLNMKRVRRMMALIEGYIPDGTVNQEMIIFGFTNNNLIYTKEEK